MKTKLIWILAFLIVITLPQIQAVTINTGTSYQTSDGNLTINFTAQRFADQIIVGNDSIYFNDYRLTDTTSETLTFNITEIDKYYNHTDLPYYSDTLRIMSGLTSNLNLNANFTASCQDILQVDSTAKDDVTYTCSNSIITIPSLTIVNGENIVAIQYDDGGDGATTGGTPSSSPTLNVTLCSEWSFCWFGTQERECNEIKETRTCTILGITEQDDCNFTTEWSNCINNTKTKSIYEEINGECTITKVEEPCQEKEPNAIQRFLNNLVQWFIDLIAKI